MSFLRTSRSNSRRENRGVFGLVGSALIIAACGGGSTEVAPESTATETTVSTAPSTTVAATTTTSTEPEVKSCDPMPESNLELTIETDLPDEVTKPFICGLHAAALEFGGQALDLTVAMFEDKAAMKSSYERWLPGDPFEGSQADLGYWGLVGSTFVFWNYPMTLDNASNEAFVFRVGTHELFHRLQSSLMYSGSLEASPVWLIEASAEYFALSMLDKYGFNEHLDEWRSFGDAYSILHYATDPGTFAKWESYPFGEGLRPYVNYPIVAEAGAMLAELSSPEAVLKTFWSERTLSEPWQETFERVFGLTVDDFYEMVDAEFTPAP